MSAGRRADRTHDFITSSFEFRRVLLVEEELVVVPREVGRRDRRRLGPVARDGRDQLYHDVYSGELKLYGAEHESTLLAANNYASALNDLKDFKEAKALLRKTIPIARRVLGEGSELGLGMRMNYAVALYRDPSATLDDLREAVTTLEDTKRIARRVFGGAHPLTKMIEKGLRAARAALRARDTPSSSA